MCCIGIKIVNTLMRVFQNLNGNLSNMNVISYLNFTNLKGLGKAGS